MVKHKGDPSKFPRQDQHEHHGLILYNDDINSFDFVISSLVEVCMHEPEQAEQCALIAHFKGKCHIMNGTMAALKPMNDELTLRGLTVTLE